MPWGVTPLIKTKLHCAGSNRADPGFAGDKHVQNVAGNLEIRKKL